MTVYAASESELRRQPRQTLAPVPRPHRYDGGVEFQQAGLLGNPIAGRPRFSMMSL